MLLRCTHSDAACALALTPLLCSPAGTFQKGTTCTVCTAGTYRSGPAARGNNACKRIPPGSRAATTPAAKLNLQQFPLAAGSTHVKQLSTGVSPCPKGTEAFYFKGARMPSLDDACRPCAANTFAAKPGLAKCKPCASGTYTKALKPGAKFGASSCAKASLRLTSLRHGDLTQG